MSTEILDVERLTYGADALAHRDRQVVFVPYAAPGDRVEATLVEERRGWVRARVERVIGAGPARVVPGCRWFPTCGGCQWQHVAPATQREAKAAVVAEQLARVAGVRDATVLPTLAGPVDWGHRARVTLVAEGRRAGYHRARSHTLVEIADCPIAHPDVQAHLDVARAWLAALRVAVERVSIARAPGGVVLTAEASGRPGPADRAASERLLVVTPSVRGAVLRGPGGSRLVIGDPTVRTPLEPGLDLEVPGDVFTQVNPGANARLVGAVLGLGDFRGGETILDLYAGAGNFGLPIARRGARVLAIERDPIAVAAGRENATRHRLGVEFREAAVAAALPELAPGTADAVVLDPPRAGAVGAVAALGALRAPRILYVSCDPATMARDVRALAGSGYRVGRVQPVDLFPHTYHVESVTELLLT